MKSFTANITVALGYFLIVGLGVFGYFANIYKLTKCDFEPSYKAEVIRGIGIVVPPVGIVTGYLNLGK